MYCETLANWSLSFCEMLLTKVNILFSDRQIIIKKQVTIQKDQYFIILQICWKSIKILWQFGCLWILPVLFRGRMGRTLKFLLSLSGLIRGNCGTDLNMNYIFYFTSSTDLSLCFLVLWNGSFLFLLRI